MSALVQNSTDASPNKAAELEKHTFLLQQELADKDHRLEKAKEKIKTMKNKLEHTEARLIKVYQNLFFELINFNSRKIALKPLKWICEEKSQILRQNWWSDLPENRRSNPS